MVSPIFDSLGEISFKEIVTTLALTLSPTLSSLLLSFPINRWFPTSVLIWSSWTCETCKSPSRGPNRTNAPYSVI